MECPICFEDIETPSQWVTDPALPPEVMSWCWECITTQRVGHYKRWFTGMKKADCAAMLRRIIKKGPPPMTIADCIDGLSQPVSPGYGVVTCGDVFESGKLLGSMVDEKARQTFWEELQQRLALFELIEREEREEREGK